MLLAAFVAVGGGVAAATDVAAVAAAALKTLTAHLLVVRT